MTTETRLVAIRRETENTTPIRFEEWRNCKPSDSKETIALLALNKWMRESGYQAPGVVFSPFSVSIFVATPQDARYENGQPKTCHSFVMQVTPTK